MHAQSVLHSYSCYVLKLISVQWKIMNHPFQSRSTPEQLSEGNLVGKTLDMSRFRPEHQSQTIAAMKKGQPPGTTIV